MFKQKSVGSTAKHGTFTLQDNKARVIKA